MGNRYSSVIHARLRNNCSSLNDDLFRNHVRNNPLCEWCSVMEDAIHFLFHCIKYIGEREVFIDTFREFLPLTIYLILFGSENWNIETNMVLFKAIHRYIHASKRFDKLVDSFVETNVKQILKTCICKYEYSVT